MSFLKSSFKKTEHLVPVESKEGKKTKPVQKTYTKTEEIDILTPFKELYYSNIGKVLKDYSKSVIPLTIVGHYLNFAGNHLLNYVY